MSVCCVSNCMECGNESVQGVIAFAILRWGDDMVACMQECLMIHLVRHMALSVPGL